MRNSLVAVIAVIGLSMAASTAPAAPPGLKANLASGQAEKLRSGGPSALLGRQCASLDGIPVWGGIKAVGAKKAPTELKAQGLNAKCSGGVVSVVTIQDGYPGKLPKGTSWGMRWKDVYKTLKKQDLKDRTNKDKKASGGPAVVLMAKGRGASVTWKWADPKGKGNVDRIIFK